VANARTNVADARVDFLKRTTRDPGLRADLESHRSRIVLQEHLQPGPKGRGEIYHALVLDRRGLFEEKVGVKSAGRDYLRRRVGFGVVAKVLGRDVRERLLATTTTAQLEAKVAMRREQMRAGVPVFEPIASERAEDLTAHAKGVAPRMHLRQWLFDIEQEKAAAR
jgi:hypothetical protein